MKLESSLQIWIVRPNRFGILQQFLVPALVVADFFSKLVTDMLAQKHCSDLLIMAGPARRGLNILREDGKLAIVPKIRLHKEPGARKGFTEPAKFEELLAALPSYLQPLIALLCWTGVRKGEALAIEWDQVDLAGAKSG